MRLSFFGRLRDTVGAGEVDRAVPPAITDSDGLRSWLGAEFPELRDATVRIALDDVLISGNLPIAGVAEACFLPPVSGG